MLADISIVCSSTLCQISRQIEIKIHTGRLALFNWHWYNISISITGHAIDIYLVKNESLLCRISYDYKYTRIVAGNRRDTKKNQKTNRIYHAKFALVRLGYYTTDLSFGQLWRDRSGSGFGCRLARIVQRFFGK